MKKKLIAILVGILVILSVNSTQQQGKTEMGGRTFPTIVSPEWPGE